MLGDYLAKIRERITAAYGYKEVVVECIATTYKISIARDSIKLQKGVLFLTIPATLKSAILMRKQFFLEELVKKGVKVRDVK
jgi:hypothetical protein